MSVALEIQHASAPGTPRVHLHGFLGSPALWNPLLVPEAPMAVVTLPGHGPAPWIPAGARFTDVTDALVSALPFARPAWLVGYSMGARLALTMLLRHPDRFAGAVLVGVDPGLRTESERATRSAWDESQAHALEAHGLETFVSAWEALPLFATQSRLPASVQAQQRAERLGHTASGLAWAMRTLGLASMPPLWDALKTCPRPLHLVSGARDDKFTALGRAIADTAPQAVHHVIPDAGHNVVLEAPAALAAIVGALESSATTVEKRTEP